MLCIVVLVAVSVFVILIRRGTTGRSLDALRGSETAAQSIGINPTRMRILAFSVSAGIAGLGGGLLATQKSIATTTDFGYFYGLFFVVLVVTLMPRTVEGAINAGLGFALVPEVLKMLGVDAGYQFVLFGLGAITYARHPEGVLEFQKRKSLAAIERRLPDRWRSTPIGAEPAVAGAVDGMTLLNALERDEAVRRHHRARCGRPRGRRWRGGRADRSERRRQDDLLQLPAGVAARRWSDPSSSRAATSPACPSTAGRGPGSAERSNASSCSPE